MSAFDVACTRELQTLCAVTTTIQTFTEQPASKKSSPPHPLSQLASLQAAVKDTLPRQGHHSTSHCSKSAPCITRDDFIASPASKRLATGEISWRRAEHQLPNQLTNQLTNQPRCPRQCQLPGPQLHAGGAVLSAHLHKPHDKSRQAVLQCQCSVPTLKQPDCL